MISKQAVLELINETPMQASHFIALMDKINALPSISDGWISIETQLPEHFDDVIFLYENGFQVIGKYSINSKRYLTHLGEDYDNNPNTFNRITHWQPRPNPPQK